MTTVTISLSWFVLLAVESTVPVVLPESISFSVSCPMGSDEITGYNVESLPTVNKYATLRHALENPMNSRYPLLHHILSNEHGIAIVVSEHSCRLYHPR